MSLPTHEVSFGFGSVLTDAIADITWTDVTAYVEDWDTDRGRSSELDEFQPGTARIVLRNEDRRFDPEHDGSPYWPNVQPMTPVRIRATHDGTTRYIYMGYVTSWPQACQPPEQSLITISCVDGFDRLANAPLPRSVWLWEHQTSSPRPGIWWALDESTGVTAANSRTDFDEYPGQWSGGTVGEASLVPFDSGGRSATWDGVDDTLYQVNRAFVTADYTFAFWIKTTDTSATLIDFARTGDTRRRLRLDSGSLRLDLTTGVAWTTSSPVNDGEAHYVAVVPDGSPEFWVDGTAVVSTSTSVTMATDDNIWLTVGNDRFNGDPFEGQLDEVMVYSSALSETQVQERYGWATAPYTGDTTGERIDRYLDLIDWPSADRDIATGISTVSPASLSENALPAIKAAEVAEAGQFFMSANGQAVFRDRHYFILNSAVTATLGEDPGAGEFQFEPELTFRYDRDLIRNSISGRRKNGPDLVPVTDTSSIASYGLRTFDVGEIDAESDDAVRARMEWTLDHYKDPILRAESVTLMPLEDSSDELWSFVLDAEIGQRVVLKRHPQEVGDTIEKTMIIEGIAHSCVATKWATTLKLSPADDREYWIVGTSELGSTTRLAY